MLPMKKFGKKEVVDWKAISKGFEFMLNETRCEVVSNEMVSKVSRNGRVRKERRLTVRVVGTEVTIEISSTSFKNMSFGKRLAKAMGEAPKAKTIVFAWYTLSLVVMVRLSKKLISTTSSVKTSIPNLLAWLMPFSIKSLPLILSIP